jgi:nicotinamide-nucleotide amidase
MFPPKIIELATSVIAVLSARNMRLVTAESCTGGLVAGALTEIAGSSAVLHGGFVTYANEAKSAMIGVNADLIAAHGAVSEPVVRAMAEGALRTSVVDVAVAITGIAGPGGGSELKPVGLIHFAVATRSITLAEAHRFNDHGRQAIRLDAVTRALTLIVEAVRR